MPFRKTIASTLAGLLLAGGIAGCALPLPHVEPGVASVAAWGGTPADPARARQHSITRITLHHQREPFKPGTDPLQYLRKLQAWSRATKGWVDIPYHYVIDLDGRIYAGRDIAYAGDTNTEYDPTGHALIEVVGNLEEVEPNQKRLDAVVDLMSMLAVKYKVPAERILSHKDYTSGTVCPGANLYRYVANGYFRDQVSARLAPSR